MSITDLFRNTPQKVPNCISGHAKKISCILIYIILIKLNTILLLILIYETR